MSSVFDPWLRRWALTPDGDPIFSNWSQLLPVRRGNDRLMLKAAMAEQEIAGSAFLQWLDGEGAGRVLERQDDAVLLERLDGPDALAELAKLQGDGAALAVLCGVAHHRNAAASMRERLRPSMNSCARKGRASRCTVTSTTST